MTRVGPPRNCERDSVFDGALAEAGPFHSPSGNKCAAEPSARHALAANPVMSCPFGLGRSSEIYPGTPVVGKGAGNDVF